MTTKAPTTMGEMACRDLSQRLVGERRPSGNVSFDGLAFGAAGSLSTEEGSSMSPSTALPQSYTAPVELQSSSFQPQHRFQPRSPYRARLEFSQLDLKNVGRAPTKSRPRPPQSPSSVVCEAFRRGECRGPCPNLHRLEIGKPVPSRTSTKRGNTFGNAAAFSGTPFSSPSRQLVDGKARVVAVKPADGAPTERRIQKVDSPCFQWERGRCDTGDACRYRHDGKAGSALAKGTTRMGLGDEHQHEVPNGSGAGNPGASGVENAGRTEGQAELERVLKEIKIELGKLRGKDEEGMERKGEIAKEKGPRAVSRTAKRMVVDEERHRGTHLKGRERIDEGEAMRREKEREKLAEQEKLRYERAERLRKAQAELLQKREKERQMKMEAQRKQEAEMVLTLVVGTNLVTFSAGLNVLELVPGFELCSVILHDLPDDTKPNEIIALFSRSMSINKTTFHIAHIRPGVDKRKKVATVFMRAEDAGVVPFALEEIPFRNQSLKVEVGANAGWGSMNSSSKIDTTTTLTISWALPSLTMIATCSSMDETTTKIPEINELPVFDGQKIRAALNTVPAGYAAKYWTPSMIKLTNISPSASVAKVADFVGIAQVRQIKSPTYDLPSVKTLLETNLQKYNPVKDSSIVTEMDDKRLQAKIQFSSYDDAESAYEAIRSGAFGKFPTFFPLLPKRHEYLITIPAVQYEAQKRRWDELSSRGDVSEGEQPKAFIRVKKGNASSNRMWVKVLGSDQEKVGILKVRIESLVAGERFDSTHWHSSFLNSEGTKFLDKVKSDTGAYLVVDHKRQCLRLFGENEVLANAKGSIREEVERLNGVEWEERIPRHGLRFFMQTGLGTLREYVGEKAVSLDLNTGTVKIKGGDDARQLFRKLLNEATSMDALPSCSAEAGSEDNSCPICGENTTTEPFICGHTYCHICLQHYLISALELDKFPLVCMGNDATCNTPIPIPLIQRYLNLERFNRLAEVALTTYIHHHPQQFKHCPTPDCTQTYRCDKNRKEHRCPSCFLKICGSCEEVAHEGMSCEDAKVQRDPNEQDRLSEEWLKENDARKCPNCSMIVVKVSGCNHMTCSKCNGHFCWVCMKAFSAEEVYPHLTEVHGGYGL